MSKVNVRFLSNFITRVVRTQVNGDGNLSVKTIDKHIGVGEIYRLEQYERNAAGKLDLHLSDGVVMRNLEPECCEIIDAQANADKKASTSGGCGCGGTGKK
jgi:hypothetical protein